MHGGADRSQVTRCVSKEQPLRCYSIERAVFNLANAAGYRDRLLLRSGFLFKLPSPHETWQEAEDKCRSFSGSPPREHATTTTRYLLDKRIRPCSRSGYLDRLLLKSGFLSSFRRRTKHSKKQRTTADRSQVARCVSKATLRC